MHTNEDSTCRRFNRIIQRYRICVEHAIAELKEYRAVGTVWRHRRRALPRIVTILQNAEVCSKPGGQKTKAVLLGSGISS